MKVRVSPSHLTLGLKQRGVDGGVGARGQHVGGTWATGEASVGAVDGGTAGDRAGLARQNREGCVVQGLETSGAGATVAGLPWPAFWAATSGRTRAGFRRSRTGEEEIGQQSQREGGPRV